jgi:hypothetical protein
MSAELSSLPTPESLLAQLWKWMTVVVQASRVHPADLRMVLYRAQVHAGGIGEAEIQALLTAKYVQECPGEVRTQPAGLAGDNEAGLGLGLAVTEEGAAQMSSILPVARPAQASPRQPEWVACLGGGGELRLGGILVKRLRADAEGQVQVIEAFERARWVEWIDNPFHDRKGRQRKTGLRETVRRLNRGQGPARLRFHARNGGVCWEIVG